MFSTLVLTLCLSRGPTVVAVDVAPPAAPASVVAPAAAPAAPAAVLTLAQAEALAITRNLDLVAAKLDIDTAEAAKLAAGLWDNPEFSYNMQNIIVGHANPEYDEAPPSTLQQSIQTFEISQVLDIWFKKSAHVVAAGAGVEAARWQVQDAVREVRRAVQSAFVTVLREQRESDLATQSRAHYEETVGLTQKRFAAGDISEAELRKIELEQLKYVNNDINAHAELAVARAELAALMAFGSADALPATLVESDARDATPALAALLQKATALRPDLQAAAFEQERARLALRAEERDALPDLSASLGYTHSKFQASGDNPETLAFSLSIPLPLFNRNQGDIAAARIDIQRAANAHTALRIAVQHEVQNAHTRVRAARTLVDVFEQGMVERAERALAVAERSYRSGASSLLELLEAQRTHLETRAEYLQTLYDWRQASIDLTHAVGSPL